MFLQYYTVLIQSLRDEANNLYRCIGRHGWIGEEFEYISDMDHSDIELMLPITAMQLYYGSTFLFYGILTVMETFKNEIQCLAVKIRQDIGTFDPALSCGMEANIQRLMHGHQSYVL